MSIGELFSNFLALLSCNPTDNECMVLFLDEPECPKSIIER